MQEIVLDKNQNFSAPSNWEEMNAVDLVHFARITHLLGISTLSKTLLVCKLYNIPFKLFKRLKESQIIQLHGTIDWLFEKNQLRQWLLSAVRVGKEKWYGPKNQLANITGEEFMYLEAEYEGWLNDQDPKHCDAIFAILYRRKHWLTGRRFKFNPENLASGEKTAVDIKTWVKYAILINYSGCRNLIIARHPNIWKTGTGKAEASVFKRTVWADMFLELSGSKFGIYDQTIKTNLWLLLADLDKKAKQATELNNKSKS